MHRPSPVFPFQLALCLVVLMPALSFAGVTPGQARKALRKAPAELSAAVTEAEIAATAADADVQTATTEVELSRSVLKTAGSELAAAKAQLKAAKDGLKTTRKAGDGEGQLKAARQIVEMQTLVSYRKALQSWRKGQVDAALAKLAWQRKEAAYAHAMALLALFDAYKSTFSYDNPEANEVVAAATREANEARADADSFKNKKQVAQNEADALEQLAALEDPDGAGRARLEADMIQAETKEQKKIK